MAKNSMTVKDFAVKYNVSSQEIIKELNGQGIDTPKGETSKLLTVLASDLGVITVNAKGVRKLSSAYLKSAQQFAFSDMLLYLTLFISEYTPVGIYKNLE